MPRRKSRAKALPRETVVRTTPAAGPPAGYYAIPEIDVRASAGPGALNDGLEETKDTWYFPDPVIRHEFRAQPADLRMITIDGDSMDPLLSSGDRILIDTSQRIPVPPGIFVIWDGMGLVAKRIEHVFASKHHRTAHLGEQRGAVHHAIIFPEHVDKRLRERRKSTTGGIHHWFQSAGSNRHPSPLGSHLPPVILGALVRADLGVAS